MCAVRDLIDEARENARSAATRMRAQIVLLRARSVRLSAFAEPRRSLGVGGDRTC